VLDLASSTHQPLNLHNPGSQKRGARGDYNLPSPLLATRVPAGLGRTAPASNGRLTLLLGLAVLIFQLLFLGRHPFFGRFSGHGEMPPERAIRELRFAYGRNAGQFQMKPPPFSLPLSFLPSGLAESFERAFSAGGQRPTADDWRVGIQSLLGSLGSCSRDTSHRFPASQSKCPWCELEANGGPAFFVAIQLANGSVFVARAADLDDLVALLSRLPAFDRGEPQASPSMAIVPMPLLPEGFIRNAAQVRRASTASKASFVAACLGVWMFAVGASVGGTALFVVGLAIVAVAQLLLSSKQAAISAVTEQSRSAQAKAQQAFADARARWTDIVSKFETTEREGRSRVDSIRRDYSSLQQQHDAERRRLSDDRENSQRQAFLRTKFLSSHEIRGIKAGRKAALRSYGFETALDVLTQNVQQVPGFGPKLKSILVSWAKSQESSFKFDPRIAVSDSEIRALVGRYQQRKSSLRNSAQSVVAEMQRLATLTANELNVLRGQVLLAEKDQLVAKANLDALAAALPKTSRGFWTFALSVFGLGVFVAASTRQMPSHPVVREALSPPTDVIELNRDVAEPPLVSTFVTSVTMPRSCTLRATPAPSSDLIGSIKIGAQVGLGELENGWRKVRLASGQEGWTGPKCWLPTAAVGSSCREDSDCHSEHCAASVCE
jgi:DNA-binding helix-hairpin-helix protein with protein kinase domain